MKIERVWFDDDNIYVVTDSGHTIGNPLEWFPRLHKAKKETDKLLHCFEISNTRDSIHWPELDEDLSLESFFDFKRELNYARI